MEPPSYTYGEGGDTRSRGFANPGQVPDGTNNPGASDSIPFSSMQSQLGHMMWEAGSKQVQDTFKSYGRIDLFRPYFDVEPVEVRSRLLRSFIPRKPSKMSVSPDLYGPSMVVLTMVALLLFNMKSSGFIVPNGTLMGTSFFTCFGAWFFISGSIYLLCFLLAADIPMLHMLSIFGYSLTSHCVVLLLTSLFHPAHDHIFFFVLVTIICIPSAIRMGLLVGMNSRVPTNRLILAGFGIAVHFILIVYLHFGFHVMVEELDMYMDGGTNSNEIQHSVPL